MKKLNKIFWWGLIVLWSTPEFIYMFNTKEPSKIAHWLFNKLKL